MNIIMLRVLIGATILSGGIASAANTPPYVALSRLEKGEWELRQRGEPTDVRKLCVGDVNQLLQIAHGHESCKRYVVSDTADLLTVTYQCADQGGGRTDVRVETPRLAQVRSQGVAGGAPFSFAFEARRTGECHN